MHESSLFQIVHSFADLTGVFHEHGDKEMLRLATQSTDEGAERSQFGHLVA